MSWNDDDARGVGDGDDDDAKSPVMVLVVLLLLLVATVDEKIAIRIRLPIHIHPVDHNRLLPMQPAWKARYKRDLHLVEMSWLIRGSLAGNGLRL